MGYNGPQAPCAKCGCSNFVIRRRCRECGADLPVPEAMGDLADTVAQLAFEEAELSRLAASTEGVSNPYKLPPEAAEIAERYCLGLLVSETGEALRDLGNGLRFGLDTPHSADLPETAREHLVHELGDLLAAAEFACLHGLFDRAGIEAARDRKLARLCDPANVDHLGRPLAPQPIELGGAALPCRLESWSTSAGTMSLMLKDNGALYGFDVSQPVAERILVSILAAFPSLVTVPAAPPRTTLTTSRREGSLATFVFERAGEPVELDLDWETAREVRTAIDARFPDAGR